MTRSKKIGLSLAAIAIIALGIDYYFNPWPHTSLDPRFHPHVKPYPKKFLTIYGHVDKRLKVKLSSLFFTNNPKCSHLVAVLEGADGPYSAEYDDSIKPDKSSNYKIKIPIDRLKPGFCDWENAGLSFMGSYGDPGNGMGIVGFSKKPTPKNPKILNINCTYFPKDKYQLFACKLSPTYAGFTFKPNASSRAHINYYFKIKT